MELLHELPFESKFPSSYRRSSNYLLNKGKKKKKKKTPNNKESVGFADPLIFKLILPHVVHLLTLAVRCEQEVCEKPGGDRTSGSENGSRETGSYVSSVGAGEERYE